MSKITKNLIFLLHILVGLFIIFYTIYRRVFLVKLPENLNFVSDDIVNYVIIYITVISLFIFTVLLIVHVRNVLFQNKSEPNNFISSFLKKIGNFYEDALITTYSFFLKLIPGGVNKISLLGEKFYVAFHETPETFLLFIIYAIRIVVLIAFLIDVFFYFCLNFMYIALHLVIISALIKVFIFMLRDYAANLEDVAEYLIIEYKGIDPVTELPIHTYSLKDEYKTKDLHYYIRHFIVCSKLQGYFEMYDKYKNFFSPYINIPIYSLYLIGWLYVLISNVT